MASTLLDKLKVKKPPQLRESIEIQLKPASKQEEVEIYLNNPTCKPIKWNR